MLDFIKRLFKTKEKIGLTLESLEEWFDNKTKEFYRTSDQRIEQIKKALKEEIEKAKENIRILEEAKLKNENIPSKEKNFMEGNRSFYAKRITIFINSMILPEKALKEFIEKTKKEINDLGNNTFKAYQILQHFFEHEAYSIAQNIKRIDNLLKELEKNISDYNLENTKRIRLGIKEFKDSIIKKEELKNTVKNIESKINKLEKEKRQLFEEISQKQKSDEYKDYYRLEVEQYKIKEDIEELKAEFLHHFSVLEHSLKKHLKVSFEDEKLLAKYVENPISALLEDENLDIINILKKVENNILKDIIELKDKKKEKTLETINQINHEKINPFLDEYKKITEKLKKVSEKMGSCSVLDEIEKIKKKFDEKRDEIEKVKKDLEDANKNLLDIDLNKIKKELKEKIDDFLNVDLSLDQE